jgi:hypothetical protein
MILADKRYNQLDKRKRLPNWILKEMKDSHINLSTDAIITISQKFLREMSQPFNEKSQIGKVLLKEEDVLLQNGLNK